MTVPVGVVIERILLARPDRSPAAVTNLLFLCQGYYVSRFLAPLILNMFATDPAGVALEAEADRDQYTVDPVLSDPERAVIDDVVTRYGHLSDDVLTELVCATWPWKEAYGGGFLIAPEVIRDDFLRTLPDVGTTS